MQALLGVGIADQICLGMMRAGLSEVAAREHFWLLDRPGLLLKDMKTLLDFQTPYARSLQEVQAWQLQDLNCIQLLDVIRAVKPTVLIGCSAVQGAFNETVIKALCQQPQPPIVLPLSNPNTLTEAYPADILHWSRGACIGSYW